MRCVLNTGLLIAIYSSAAILFFLDQTVFVNNLWDSYKAVFVTLSLRCLLLARACDLLLATFNVAACCSEKIKNNDEDEDTFRIPFAPSCLLKNALPSQLSRCSLHSIGNQSGNEVRVVGE